MIAKAFGAEHKLSQSDLFKRIDGGHKCLEAAFDLHIIARRVNFEHVGFSAMCVGEARLLLSGHDMIIGMPFAKVPGDTLAKKRGHLYECSPAVLEDRQGPPLGTQRTWQATPACAHAPCMCCFS